MININIININKSVCNNNGELRTTIGNDIINESFDECYLSDKNDEEYIKMCLRCAALIKLYQPFVDGNHRTGLMLFAMLLNKNGIAFDIDSAIQDMKNKKLNLPTFYSEKDEITSIINYEKYIINQVISGDKGAGKSI